jgi:4-diphosphocytidyl-2-C-methyl-D-erythritol kinase
VTALAARAPGKVNLCLYLGSRREDDRHELVSVVQSVSLADDLVLEPAPAGASRDMIECAAVDAPNLAATALDVFRARTGWADPPQHLLIRKLLPVAGGMGGGSADAAAALRMAASRAEIDDEALLMDLASGLGADVPAQVRPGRTLVEGAGERVTRLPDPAPFGLLIVPSLRRLSTADVFAEADRLGLGRDAGALATALDAVRSSLAGPDRGQGAAGLPAELMINELEPAALSLCPELDEALETTRGLGADVAMVSGSGPTVFGFFGGSRGLSRAETAARALSRRDPTPVAAIPVGEDFGRPGPLAVG